VLAKMITINKATKNGVRALSKKLLKMLKDKNSQLYQDNVAKFGIPDEYAKGAFSERTLLEAYTSGKSTFYIALENKCEILGFAQAVRRDLQSVELDRIVVFPENTRKHIGTRLLNAVVLDEKLKGSRSIVVNAGKEERHARLFYEKNGFKLVKERTTEYPWGSKITLVTYELELR
jgi:ribosomal protein S18 acetylase RimI-like enzyme